MYSHCLIHIFQGGKKGKKLACAIWLSSQPLPPFTRKDGHVTLLKQNPIHEDIDIYDSAFHLNIVRLEEMVIRSVHEYRIDLEPIGTYPIE